MRRRSSSKRNVAAPCPGCGEAGKRRFADEVCDECKDQREQFLALQKELAKLADRKRNVLVVVHTEGWAHNLPYIANAYRAHENSNELQRALVALAHSLGVRVSYKAERQSGYSDTQPLIPLRKNEYMHAVPPLIEMTRGGSGEPVLALTQETVDTFRRLYAAVEEAVHAAYVNGIDQGSSLLMGLHSGEITLAEMEKRLDSAHKKRERRTG